MDGIIKPNFFIVGAAKSATTALYSYLKKHPDVFLAKKELNYFSHDLNYRTEQYPEYVYLSYFSKAAGKKAIGDASVHYLISQKAATKIKKFNKDARIIIMLRNPADMVYSLYSEQFFQGDETIKNFEQALDADTRRRTGIDIPLHRNCPVESLLYKSVANYYEQVLRYTSVFEKDKILIILFDEFIKNTRDEYKRVLNFLGLKEIMPAGFEVVNANKTSKNKLLQMMLVNPPDFMKKIFGIIFPHHSKRRIWLVNKLWDYNAEYVRRDTMKPETRQLLLHNYRDDILNLQKLIDKDISSWLDK